jgi:hypothetical protein
MEQRKTSMNIFRRKLNIDSKNKYNNHPKPKRERVKRKEDKSRHNAIRAANKNHKKVKR